MPGPYGMLGAVWEMLAILALIAVGSVLARWIRGRIAARKQRRYESGQRTRIPVRVRGGRPFPRRAAWGSVDTADDPLVFRRWHRVGAEVPLSGLTLLSRRLDLDAPGPEPLVVFRFRDQAGAPVDVAVAETHADLFDRVLRAEPRLPAPAATRPRSVPRWRIALALLAVLWLAAWAYLALAGTIRTGAVLANDEDYCRVEWTHDGRAHDAWIDCYGQQPGETVRFIALPAPFVGEAVDVVTTRVVVPLLALPFLLPLAFYGVRRLRGRDAPVPGSRAPLVIGEVDVPPLAAHDLRWPAIEAHVRRRAEDEQWRTAWTQPWWARRFRSPDLQRVAKAFPAIVLVPLFVLVAVAGYGWTPLVTAWRYDDAAARPVIGTVVTVDGMTAPVPWDVELEFEIDGHQEHVRVASLREPDYDEQLAIRYDAEHDVARLLGDDDGVERGVLLAAIAVGLAAAFSLWRTALLTYRLIRVRRARRQPAVPMRYAVVQDFAAQPLLLLFDAHRDKRPEVVVPLSYLPDVPLTGSADVHGQVAPGGVVVFRAGQTLLYPGGPVLAIDEDELLAVLNAEEPWETE